MCEHAFVTVQGAAYMRFRRALGRGNVTEALSGASELQFVGLAAVGNGSTAGRNSSRLPTHGRREVERTGCGSGGNFAGNIRAPTSLRLDGRCWRTYQPDPFRASASSSAA